MAWSGLTHTFEPREETIPVKGLLTIEGIRFLFTSFVPNFQNFGVIAVTFIAMMGAGLAESAGLMGALIRKLVAVAPRRLIAFLIILVGGAVECRFRRWLSDPDSAGGRGVRQPEAQPDCRSGGGLCRRRRDLRRQHHHPADRRHARRDDQRSHRADGRRTPDDRQQLLLQRRLAGLPVHRGDGDHRANDRAATECRRRSCGIVLEAPAGAGRRRPRRQDADTAAEARGLKFAL